jgi:membrane protease YdiL (CAAX protease family)
MEKLFLGSESRPANKIWGTKVIRINALLLIFYFCIRLLTPFLTLSSITIPKWILVSSEMFIFLIIGGLIFLNRKRLPEYHIDYSAVLIFFLFSTVLRYRRIDSVATFLVEILFLALAIIVLIIFWRSKKVLVRQRLFTKWFFLAILLGFVLGMSEIRFDPHLQNKTMDSISITTAIFYFFYYAHQAIGSAGIFEEPIYRGFLWGFLRNIGLSEGQTLIAQGGLFWISHINFIHYPFTFWITASVMALVLGFLALRSKSIIPPIIAHVIYNAYIALYVL